MLGAECVAVGQDEATVLHQPASRNFLKMAELLLGAGASVDAKSNVRPGCSCLVAECVVVLLCVVSSLCSFSLISLDNCVLFFVVSFNCSFLPSLCLLYCPLCWYYLWYEYALFDCCVINVDLVVVCCCCRSLVVSWLFVFFLI